MSVKEAATAFQKNIIGWLGLILVIVGMWVTTQKDMSRIETELKFVKEVQEKQEHKIIYNDEKVSKKLDVILETLTELKVQQAKNNTK